MHLNAYRLRWTSFCWIASLAKEAPLAPLIGALSSSPLSRLASGARTLDRSITFAFQDVDSIARSRNLRRRKPTAASIRPSSQSYRGLAECRGAPAASQASSCGCPQPASSIAELFRLAGSGTVGGWEQPPPQRVFVVNSTTPPHLGACWAAAPLVRAGPTWPLYPYIHIALMWGPSSAFPASTTVPAPAYI